MRRVWMGGVLAAVLLLSPAAEAAQVKIVALGASNTSGHGRGRTSGGVPRSRAWPAQLQALLRAHGIDAHVTNAGVPGDTPDGMLTRLSRAVPPGTQIVILQPGHNDVRRGQGSARAGYINQIKHKLAARHIKVIMIGKIDQIAPRSTRDPDGQHFNVRGHAAIARSLVPKVLAALK